MVLFLFLIAFVEGSGAPLSTPADYIRVTDTIPGNDTSDLSSGITDTTYVLKDINSNPYNAILCKDTLNIPLIGQQPYVALQQMLKGEIAGVYVQEPSGEPGTEQNIYIRGLSRPVFTHRDLYGVKPAVYLDGIPLIGENPFVFDIQNYDYDRLGPATNLLSAIDLDNVQSVEVLKDADALGLYGPTAANGAIMITTKNAEAGNRRISINSYFGYVQKPEIVPVNAEYIANQRQRFYDKYATVQEKADYPEYLANTSDGDYYGPANWTDLYYKNTLIHSINGSLTGGSERANFRFFAGETQGSNPADGTELNRYNASFFINMLPITWLTVSTMLNATRLERQRNTSLRDRFAEMNYLPDLTYPLPPNKGAYGSYVTEYQKSFDKNKNNSIQGSFAVKAHLNKLDLVSRLAFDYNEGLRDIFWPSTLLEGNNYVSNYFGSNQRLILDNILTYNDTINAEHYFTLIAGQSLHADASKYNYTDAYKGPSDFVKINVVEGDDTKGDYLVPQGFITYRYLDHIRSRLLSFYGQLHYSYKQILLLSALVRSDGSSYAQPESRWYVSPVFSAEWNIHEHLFPNSTAVNALGLKASWGRIGRLFMDDGIGAGPQYRVDLGWTDEARVGAYDGIATLTRPYSYGWVGYDIKWPYTETKSIEVNGSFFQNHLQADVDFYSKDDRRMLLAVPAMAESGYIAEYQQGMAVNNKGVDITLSSNIIQQKNLSWNVRLNMNYNRNELKSLPGGLNELVVGDRKLVVGSPIDQYWLLINDGIYNTDDEVPLNPTTQQSMTYNGITLKAGDPKWKDVNGDHEINGKDKVLTGHMLPKVSGGFSNVLQWKAFSFSFDLYFALGRNIINEQAANKLDFVNAESKHDMSTVALKEITFWKKTFDPANYPMYNPWSEAVPYQSDQDLFMEDGNFLKVRSVSLGYDLSKTKVFEKMKTPFTKFYLYATANNILTFTPYSGTDPELVNYLGYDTGYALPMPKTFTVGFKIDF